MRASGYDCVITQVVGACGRVPLLSTGVYVSLPADVPDLTVNVAKPLLVFWMLELTRVVALPFVRWNETPYEPTETTFPKASRTLTVPVEVDAPSATIGFGANAQARWSAPPDVQVTVVWVLLRPALARVIEQALYEPELLIANDARPWLVVVACRSVADPPPDVVHEVVSKLTLTVLPLSLVRVAPFASWMATTMMVQLASVFDPVMRQLPPLAEGCG